MPLAETVKRYLDQSGADYEIVEHPRTLASTHTAREAHVPGQDVAKAVVLQDDQRFLMVIVPATHEVELGVLHEELDRPVGLATAAEVNQLFPDCDPGAVPPLGPAYGLETLIDESVGTDPEIYFEGGDHQSLVRMRAETFLDLLRDARAGQYSHPMQSNHSRGKRMH
ncbi:YbaK/EbsC family protein [Ectothiorhodospiraceae bacterium 2226]|nr:YbaK/EbsC family protein [Ectothiorhodospiraceae bacterium 2226]